MHRILLTALGCLFLSFGTIAAADITEDFSRLEDTWAVELSPDGNTLAIGCQYQNMRSVCIVPLAGDIKSTVYPGGGASRIVNIYWGSNEHVIIVTDGTSEEELTTGVQTVRFMRAVSFNAKTGKSALLLKDYQQFSQTAFVSSLMPQKSDKVLMNLLQSVDMDRLPRAERLSRSAHLYHSFDVDLDTGRARQRSGYSKPVISVQYDEEGDDFARVIYDDRSGEFEVRSDANKVIMEMHGHSVQPFSGITRTEDGKDMLMWTDGESVSGYERGVWKLSMEDGEMSRPDIDGFEVLGNSPIEDRHTNRAVGYRYSDELSRQFFVDIQLRGIQEGIEGALPDAVIRIQSWSADRSVFIIAAEKIGTPIDFYLFNPGAGELALIGSTNEAIAEQPLGEVRNVTYPAADGLDIPGYLTLPVGKTMADAPFPAILLPHGGPDASDNAGFDWWSQAYAAAGYAVLQPNFRGSNRYGAEFREAGFGEFGGKMVTDVTDSLAWLEAEGIAKPGGACVVGASYGGYSALMAPLLSPDVVKCAISVNGVTDPIAQMGRYRQNNIEAVSYWEQYMGSTFASAEQHASITPVDRVSEYRTPVLLIHGDADTRVEFGQFEAFKKAAGRASWLTTSVMEGQDHFLSTQAARQQMLSESFAFLAVHHPVE